VQLAIALSSGALLDWLQVPIGWLLGPMVVGILWVLACGRSQPLPTAFSTAGQALVALATAASFSLEALTKAISCGMPLLLCILVTGAMSLFNGYLLSRWTGIDRATSFLGCLPGASHSLVAMSDDLGADAIAVAILQYLRVLSIVLIVPAIASFAFPATPPPTAAIALPPEPSSDLPVALNLLVLAVCGSLGVWGGRQLKLPSTVFLGPFLAGLGAFWLLPYPLQMPQPLFAAGLLAVGLSIGLKFDLQAARKLLKVVLLEAVLVLLLILVCLGVGFEFHAIAHVDTMTAVLGSTPGGISAMLATSLQLGGDSGLVLAMQMTRMLSILLLSPWLAASFFERGVPNRNSRRPSGESYGEVRTASR